MSSTPTPPRARVTLLPALPDPGIAEPPTPPTAAELLDEETRLLAQATGEHLPLELALRVAELRARRSALT